MGYGREFCRTPSIHKAKGERIMIWLFFAVGSAFFAGITSILAKMGLKQVDSYVATALRTIVVLLFAWLMVLAAGSLPSMKEITPATYLLLGMSGITTGASWICYFRALQLGDVNKVVPIDKSSTILTMLLAFVILGEPISFSKAIGMAILAAGTFLMVQRKPAGLHKEAETKAGWAAFAFLSAFFAALTAILGKLGMQGVESNLGTALRTIVVLIMAWLIVLLQKKGHEVKQIDGKSWVYLILSGLTTGASWLCYYRALKDGPASVVVPVDKLSIVVTVLFASVVLKEVLTKKAALGFFLVIAGTFLLVFL